MGTPTYEVNIQTTLAAALENATHAVTAQVTQLNEAYRNAYLLFTFANWKALWESGRDRSTPPPNPPQKWEIKTAENGFPYPGLGNTLVCLMPPLPEGYFQDSTVPVLAIGHKICESPLMFSCSYFDASGKLVIDTEPNGYTTTTKDGVVVTKVTRNTISYYIEAK